MKIAILSFADIDNYGDTFFPYVVRKELARRIPDARITLVTLTGRPMAGLEFEKFSIRSLEQNYDAVILAGGEVIHDYDERTWEPIFKRLSVPLEVDKPSDIVFGWPHLEGKFKAWFSVGVRVLTETGHAKVDTALPHLNYVSVRGLLSKKNIEVSQDHYLNNIRLTPDIGWLFPRHLRDAGVQPLMDGLRGRDYFIFQTNNIDADDARIIYESLREFKEASGFVPVLLPIIKPWEDIKYLRMIKDFDRDDSLQMMPNDLDLWQIGNLLIHSKFVVSSSLHAATTALAANLPAAIINKWQGTKLQEFFGHPMRMELLRSEYGNLKTVLFALKDQSEVEMDLMVQYSKYMQTILDHSIDGLAGELLAYVRVHEDALR